MKTSGGRFRDATSGACNRVGDEKDEEQRTSRGKPLPPAMQRCL
jgi:hypothetical protein